MSNKETEILEYINFTLKNDGYSPSVREICEAVNLKSTSTVQYHLKKLEKKGVINKSEGKSRSLHLNDSTNEFRSVPIVGEIAAGYPLTAEENKVGDLPYPESNFKISLGGIFSDNFVKPTISVKRIATSRSFGLWLLKSKSEFSISSLISGEK